MAGRAPRAGQCGAGAGPSRGPRNPGLTRAAQLRQAKSAAFVKEQGAKDDALAARVGGACEAGPRKPRVSKFTRGPPPAEPKKINMTQPGLTKAMLARMKHAQEQVMNLSRERNEAVFQKRQIPKRPPGERKLSREPKRLPPAACAPPPEPREEWRPQGALQEAAAASPGMQRLMKMREERMAATRAKKAAAAATACGEAGPSSVPGPCPKGPPRVRQLGLPQAQSTMARNRSQQENSGVSERTCELAESMNADVLQAEPVGEGPVQNIVIPPGAVSQCRTTIVALPAQNQGNTSNAANRSMQIIAETLDDQDALESSAINERLSDLQSARRDFVMAVATVGNNVINIADNPQSPPRNRGLYRLPEAEDDMFRVEYGRDHPAVIAAREYQMKTRAAIQEREADLRMEREFARAARCEDGLRLDVPIEQEIMEGDISFEEDESGVIIPCASRIKASMPPIPRKHVAAVRDAIGPDELERFFNVERYPTPCDSPSRGRQCDSPSRGRQGPPPGRTRLNQDLWDLEDPWYKECPPPEMPDLIDFNDF